MAGDVFHRSTVNALAMALLNDGIARQKEAKRQRFRSQMARLVVIEGRVYCEDVMSNEELGDAYAAVMGRA